MALVYKIWICIEEYDTATGEGTDVDAPGSSLMTYRTEKEAWDAALLVTTAAEQIIPAGIMHDDSEDGGIEDIEPSGQACAVCGAVQDCTRDCTNTNRYDNITTRVLEPDAPDVPDGLMPRVGVFFGCGLATCADCYEPKTPDVRVTRANSGG